MGVFVFYINKPYRNMSREESPMLKKLREYFANTPREQILKDWEETKEKTKDIISPTVGEFLGWHGIVLAERKPLMVSIAPVFPCSLNIENPPYVNSDMSQAC